MSRSVDVDVWSQATCGVTYTGVAAIRWGMSRYTIYTISTISTPYLHYIYTI